MPPIEEAPSPDPKKGARPAARSSRLPPTSSSEVGDDSEASDMEAASKITKSTSRRRQSTLGIRASANIEPVRESTQTAKRVTSTPDLPEVEGQGGRGSERVAARRRSMML